MFTFNWLSATGSGIFVAALIAALVMRLRHRAILQVFWQTVVSTRFTMITIAALMGLAFVTRFCGLDATLGLAFARTGTFYPFFGTLIGWLGTASTGSDTSANVLFGSLQKFTAQQLGISPYIMASANSGGGVMGKMVAPQSVVVASTATGHLRQRREYSPFRLHPQLDPRLPDGRAGLSAGLFPVAHEADSRLTVAGKGTGILSPRA